LAEAAALVPPRVNNGPKPHGELAPPGKRVNVISPGSAIIPSGRKITYVAVVRCSGHCFYVNGSNIVDGGMVERG
jgi:hypothetical protein